MQFNQLTATWPWKISRSIFQVIEEQFWSCVPKQEGIKKRTKQVRYEVGRKRNIMWLFDLFRTQLMKACQLQIRIYRSSALVARCPCKATLVLNMIPKVFFLLFTLLLHSQAEGATRNNKSPSVCHCRPVINVSVDDKGQCDLCKGNNQLLQEVDDLKKELATIKDQVQQGK